MSGASTDVAKYIGGVYYAARPAGSPRAAAHAGRRRAKQREALKLIADGVFSADSFRFKPEFLRRMQVDYLDRNDIFDSGLSAPGFDYSLQHAGARYAAQGAERAHERRRARSGSSTAK